MKKQAITLAAVAGLAFGASIAFAGSLPGTGIVGSKHDMFSVGNNNAGYTMTADTQQRVCAYCHTPHHKVDASNLDYNPLWSHDINNSAFTPYGAKTVTFDGSVSDPLTGPSRLCMSCHDGVIAVDQHYGIAGTASATSTRLRGDSWNEIAVGQGNTLAGDHPIGFDIDSAVWADATNGGMTVFGGAIKGTLDAPNNTKLTGKPFSDVGFNTGSTNIFTCASCHEVHNKDNVDAYFLYEKQAGSKICLMCHDK